MKKSKFLGSILGITFVISVFLTGCGNDEKKLPVKYALDSAPVSLDPQFASKDSETEILINCYQGLFREIQDGKVENLCCESYDVSSSGLKYEFKLKDDIFYSDDKRKDFVKKEVTADDFVFAFERLFNPKYPSPHREKFKLIKNAQEIMDGKKPLSSLGVYAKGDDTLVIELKEADNSLIKNLCHTSAMPVSREYFEKTKGKFGVDDDNFVSNGGFRLTAWDKEKYATLRRNPNYKNSDKIFLNGIDFYFNRDESPAMLFANNRLDIARVSEADIKSYPQLKSAKLLKNENAVWVIGLNQKNETLRNENLSNSLSLSFDREKLLKDLEGTDLSLSSSIVSKGAKVMGERYNDESVTNRYNPIKAMEENEKAKNALGVSKISGLNILSLEDTKIYDSCQVLFQSWQKELSFFLELIKEEDDEYQKRLEKGDFDLAIFKVVTKTTSPYSALSDFKKNSSKNYIGFENDQYDSLLETALNEKDGAKSKELFKQAEDMLLKTGKIIPLFTDSEFFAVAPNLEGAEIYSYSGLVYFLDAYRK